jgi:hypothetical protein
VKRCCLLVCSILVAACNGGEDQPAALAEEPDFGGPSDTASACHPITDGEGVVSATVDPACSDCTVSDKALAGDSDLDTGAHVTAGRHPGACSVPLLVCDPPSGVAVRATAQDGVVFPSGQYPGVFLHGPGGTWSMQVRTFLDGQLQEETSLSSESSNEEHSTGTGLKASKPFDAVEVFVANDEDGDPATIEVSELCSDIPIFHNFGKSYFFTFTR